MVSTITRRQRKNPSIITQATSMRLAGILIAISSPEKPLNEGLTCARGMLAGTQNLLNSPACDPGPSAAQWLRVVRIVVTARMDHDRASTDLLYVQVRRSNRLSRVGLSIHH